MGDQKPGNDGWICGFRRGMRRSFNGGFSVVGVLFSSDSPLGIGTEEFGFKDLEWIL